MYIDWQCGSVVKRRNFDRGLYGESLFITD